MDIKTINLHPYHVEEKNDADGFVLEFWCNSANGNKVKARVHFRFWWTTYIARCLWRVIKHRETEVASAKANMTREAE
jgi:hypothetical protein